jgi:ethanolaminephosphotransferase
MTRHYALFRAFVCATFFVGMCMFCAGILNLDVGQFLADEVAAEGSGRPRQRGSKTPLYGRAVIMLIDALRPDMALRRDHNDVAHMPYLQSLVDNNTASALIAHVHTPTVTMPRVKALMTGRVPQFVDALSNMNSAELKQDNLLSQLQHAGRRAVFYGDDTWIKLFPTQFVRSDGTHSFFTKDSVEVDNNVTRHLRAELDPVNVVLSFLVSLLTWSVMVPTCCTGVPGPTQQRLGSACFTLSGSRSHRPSRRTAH